MSRRPPHGRKYGLKECAIAYISILTTLIIISVIVTFSYLNFTNDLINFLSKFVN